MGHSSLPIELLDLIGSSLSQEDHHTCASVNREWYLAFRRLLYRNVTIKNRREFARAYKTIKRDSCALRPLGYYVKELNIYGGRLTEEELIELPLLCPHTESINIHWSVWQHFAHANHSETPPRTVIQEKMSILLRSLSLTRLTLDCQELAFAVDITAVLAAAPNLLSLSFKNTSYDIYVQNLEHLHKVCPYLETLHTRCHTPLNQPTRLSVALEQCEPAYAMKTLRIQFSDTCSITAEWFQYVARKYPNLQVLDFESLDKDDTDALDFNDALRLEAFDLIAQRCQRLKAVRMVRFYIEDHFFRALDGAGIRLEAIACKPRFVNHQAIHARLAFGTVRQFQDTLTSMAVAWSSCDNPLRGLMSSFYGFAHLSDLVLSLYSCGYHLGEAFFIETILDNCIGLKTFVFEQGTLSARETRDEDMTPHGLTTLTMNCAKFDEHALEYISARCPHLDRLSMLCCSPYRTLKLRPMIQIRMPQQKFTLIDISYLKPEESEWTRRDQNEPMKFFSLTQLKNEQQPKEAVYYMNDFYKTRHRYCPRFFTRDIDYGHLRAKGLARSFRQLTLDESNVVNGGTTDQSVLCIPSKRARVCAQRQLYSERWIKELRTCGMTKITCLSVDRLRINGMRLAL
ncbi:hypothetical protein DFQ28_000115 [Apophysomyces sp. BC1034]|nr:hypothetical protein DFQ30_005050 [Apophysomyces sp. BC1015]KAG0181052.1 hypothetical protein DFQ29_009447 [Apophysomyces sp. BC1021]KAG0191459.1 hypothetical protein DFQ28_000115 [Apophysomyces sp. BC1034]